MRKLIIAVAIATALVSGGSAGASDNPAKSNGDWLGPVVPQAHSGNTYVH